MPSDRYLALSVGQTAATRHTVSDLDVVLFAAVTGDHNPVHLDVQHAARTPFGERIAHGMLTAGFISATLAMHVPGPGSVYLSQSLRFVRPVRLGDCITTRVEIVELIPAKRRVRLSTSCRNQAGDLVLDGEALILLPLAS
jgi:3-hydroxybutyryl-CoA dehydratase